MASLIEDNAVRWKIRQGGLPEYQRVSTLERILSNWQFDLPIFLIALLPKPRRSHRYACVCEAALSEKYSASNYPKFNFHYTSSHAFGVRASTEMWMLLFFGAPCGARF